MRGWDKFAHVDVCLSWHRVHLSESGQDQVGIHVTVGLNYRAFPPGGNQTRIKWILAHLDDLKRGLCCACADCSTEGYHKNRLTAVFTLPPPLHITCVSALQCVSEKWLLPYQWIGPDKMEDSGSGWGCSKVCESKREKKEEGGTVRWKHERLVLMCRCTAESGQQTRGEEGRLDVKEESRGVDGWRSRVGGVEGSVLGAVPWPLIRLLIFRDAPFEKTSTACQE